MFSQHNKTLHQFFIGLKEGVWKYNRSRIMERYGKVGGNKKS